MSVPTWIHVASWVACGLSTVLSFLFVCFAYGMASAPINQKEMLLNATKLAIIAAIVSKLVSFSFFFIVHLILTPVVSYLIQALT